MSTPQGALRLTLNYLLAAALWVVFSDTLLASLDLSVRQTEQIQVWKGLIFVLLTSTLLYLTIRKHLDKRARIGAALRLSEERLSLALSATDDGLWDWDLRQQKIYYSPGYTALLGLENGELGDTRERWLQYMHPDDRPHYERSVARVLAAASQAPYENTYRLRHRDGSYRWIQSRGRIQLDENGQPERFIGTVSDITQRRADADSLRQAAAVFEATQEGVLVTDAQQNIVHINPAFSRITGYSEAEILGQQPTLLKSGRHDSNFYHNLWHTLQTRGTWSGEVWNRRKNGEIYPQWQCIRAIRDDNGVLSYYVAVFSDISVLRRSQRELDHLAHHDPLSNLPNRLLFTERVEHALQRSQNEARRGAVLVIDLDHFKHINESLGHNVGDLLIKAAGERLVGQLDKGITLARLGGDEFGLLCEECNQAEQAAHLAQQLIDCLGDPFQLEDQELFISASVGICLYPDDAHTVEQVLRNVDSALFKAKSSGREGFAFYDQEQTEYARQRVELVGGMRHALENGELRVHYQPLCRLSDGQLIGVEALVRWQHPQRGLVPPGEFIPVAEDSGMISAIDAWVLEQACRQMVAWQAQGYAQQFVAVNLSSRLFSRGELDQRVAQVLAETGLPPACLELEVTESAVMHDPDMAHALLERLRALGVRLAIDDFGTGYSSLARLKRLPVHKLKLDQSFVAGLPHDKDDVAITRAVIALAHSMELKVLAEGIERAEQWDYLRQLGCDYAQGYYIGRPQPADALNLQYPR
ncbi:putative bifunctional diguanylate cyclase/phosphodiesterase [Phytopseudomonas dryadis]|uniref:cyclic-guanylate-specific phosphodiesterase n=1 Tax=Phytopseudomonas dryadis TaxID=2487520 RepID=A0A4Q9R8I4_9GAMM|nr:MULTISPECIES: EAL domain-containing protein [Pseudomonas]TBU96937.1 GGDEF domain-containing protein [Pseudomonas dryadis]TBV06517.1 GGDEF domain-containing protein [Pseudomonas dryadis]TBV17984.1 GGDEF domain-containing protein [Pseudomonas sp. FRB 230]